MLREEQIDIRRQRAKSGKFQIEKLGKNRVFGEYRVSNPESGGVYDVLIRGFEVGDNRCSCPDFATNTLGTCKHIEAVLDSVAAHLPPHVRQRKASITRPEILLDYTSEQLRLTLHLPPRCSDKLKAVAAKFFDDKGFWRPEASYRELVEAVDQTPEEVFVPKDAYEFIDREIIRREMAEREQQLLAELDAGKPMPGPLLVPLYEYQMRGAIFLACRGRCILGDDMGLGKTVQTMAAVELMAQYLGIARVLVIAPASVKYQWESEIRKFTTRPVQVIEGGSKMRARQYEQATFYRLVNYEQVVRDLEAMRAWQPDVIVLDEAQRIKNWESKTSRAVKKLRSRYAIVLTGTPIENRLEELYSIVQFVDDRRLGPAFQFLHEHRILDEQGNLVGYRNLEKIRERLAPIFLRRTRAEVLKQLPPRTDTVRYVRFAEEQRLPYEEQRITLARLLQKSFKTDLDRKRILSCLVNLRLICDSTFLYDKQTNVSPKLDEFAELARELVAAGGHKAVVFSQWETMILKAAEVLDRLGIGYAILHGGMPGPERRAALDRFKNEAACHIFLSTDAGGTGLNLQSADTVINLEVPWNPAVLEQRIARVHRMGQDRPVRAVHLVTRGSIEERVLKTLEAKKSLFTGIFEGDSDEISFQAMGQQAFLDSVRELIAEEVPATAVTFAAPATAPVTEVPAPPPVTPSPPTLAVADPAVMWSASVQLLEALVQWIEIQPQLPADDRLRQRAQQAAEALLRRLG